MGLSVATALALMTHFAAGGASPGGAGSARIPVAARRPAVRAPGSADRVHERALRPATLVSAPTTTTTPTVTTAPPTSTPPTTSTTLPATTTSTTTAAPSASRSSTLPPRTASRPPPPDPDRVVRSESSWSGALDYPDDVSTTYLFATAGGSVSVMVRALPPAELEAELDCAGAARRTASGTALRLASISRGSAASCTIEVSLANTELAAGTPVSYSVVARYTTTSG